MDWPSRLFQLSTRAILIKWDKRIGTLERTRGNYAEAEALYQRALAITENALGREHLDVATVLDNLAQLRLAQGDYSDAEPLFERALSIREKALGPAHPLVGETLSNLGQAHLYQSEYEVALPLFQRSLAIAENALGREHPGTALSVSAADVCAIVLKNRRLSMIKTPRQIINVCSSKWIISVKYRVESETKKIR